MSKKIAFSLNFIGLLAIALVFSACGENEEEAEDVKNVSAHLESGWTYLKDGELEEAEKSIDAAIKLDRSNVEVNVALLAISLVSPSTEINRFKIAIKAAKIVLENTPDDYVSQFDENVDKNKIKLALAQAYLYDGQIDKAQEQMSELSGKDLTNLEDLIDEIILKG